MNFRLFFTTTLMDLIVAQTNLYAQQTMDESEFESWTQVTAEELWAYMGFCILMSINHLPSLKDYWKTDEVYHYAPVVDRISRKWFLDISRYLHFTDNRILPHQNDPGYHWLQKVQPVIDSVMEACMTNYNPSVNISIDEAMIAFKGRASIKQYMPKKTYKKGYQGLDEIWQCQWICMSIQCVYGQGRQQHWGWIGRKCCQKPNTHCHWETPLRLHGQYFYEHPTLPATSWGQHICLWNTTKQPKILTCGCEVNNEEGSQSTRGLCIQAGWKFGGGSMARHEACLDVVHWLRPHRCCQGEQKKERWEYSWGELHRCDWRVQQVYGQRRQRRSV